MSARKSRPAVDAIAAEDKPTPATRHAFSAAMAKAAALPRKLRAGTFAVRFDESLLPKSPAESVDGYKLRMQRTFLLGAYEEASDRLKATIFSGGVAVDPPGPEPGAAAKESGEAKKPELDGEVASWVENFDNEGRTLLAWMMEASEEGMDCGLVHGLADHPRVPEASNLEEERRRGARPYATLLRGDELVQKAEIRRASGQLVPQRLNFLRSVRAVDGWAERYEQRVLVLHAGDPAVDDLGIDSPRWARWEEFAVDQDGKVEGAPSANGSFRPHVEIPLRTAYFRRTGFLTGLPALQGVAEKTAEHLQSSSHQRYNLDYARHPKTFRRGFNDDEKKQLKSGASAIFSAAAAHADMKEVETSGAALGAGRQHLEDCKAEIQQLAFKPYVKLTAVTAAEAAITKDDASNLATAWAYNLEAFAQELLDLFMVYRTPAGQDPKQAAVVKVNPDESLTLSPQQLDLFKLLIENRLLDDETILKVAKELGGIPEWVKVESVLEKVKTTPPRLFGPALPLQGAAAPPPPQPPSPAPAT